MRLAKSHNLTIPRTNLDIGLDIKPACKLAKSLTKTRSKMHELKTYNEAINDVVIT